MLGKASDIGTHFIDGDFIDEIQRKVSVWLDNNKDLDVIDIRHQMVEVRNSDNLYHTAQIIYRMNLKAGGHS